MNTLNNFSSDIQHNKNAYAYLSQLVPFITDPIVKLAPCLSEVQRLCAQYDETVAYGNLYSSTLQYLEEHVDAMYSQCKPEEVDALDALFFSLYHNDNHILDEADWLLELNKSIRPKHRNMEKLITHKLNDPKLTTNNLTPQKAESLFNRFNTLFTPNFKPQLETNIPSIKRRNDSFNFIEHRFSTQAQRHHGLVRISPLFQRWLLIKAKNASATQKIVHVYFNNLGLDRELLDIPGSNEKKLSLALHQLADDPQYRLAVITLPSSQGLFKTEAYKDLKPRWSYQDIFDEFYSIARFEHHKEGIVDFKISRSIRSLLFTDSHNETETLQDLLKKSFSTFGFHETDCLSFAQKQAVWLHFNKFELTRFILEKLQPESCNFSCKDAIDRGALSSLYFDLHASFASTTPLSQEEFTRQIDLSAAQVKGRGMNFHRLILWNAIDCYVTAHYDELKGNENTSWLIYWRDMNCPKARVHDLIARRLLQFEKALEQSPANDAGLQLLKAAQAHYESQMPEQRLLLEIISRSNQLLLEQPTPDQLYAYIDLAEELKKSHSCLRFFSGLMKLFVGALLCSGSLIQQGLSSIHSFFFHSTCSSMEEGILVMAAQKKSSLLLTSP
ncbi:MAG: hypothetical protein CK426_04860 [Legionella sp.]|nr:MAG: hypothetical protein CK423_04225 [Legionella sp.]PJD98818.1 MAG: hypothetical protein CK426_04860 [Legionella sp.]